MNGRDNPSYERVLALPRSFKTYLPRICLFAIYFIILTLWIFPILYLGLSFELLILIPLSLLLVILPTWKYGFVEYEYIFSGQSFCFAKIYGKRKRKQVMDLDLSNAILIAPATDENIQRASASELSTAIYATVDIGAEDIWLILFEVDKTETGVVFFHGDERSIRFLRRQNPHATARIPSSHS